MCELTLPIDEKGKIFPIIRKSSIGKRKKTIEESINLKSGKSQDNKIWHEFYSYKNFKIVMGKPGKEASKEYKGKLGDNINDMTPHLLKDNIKFDNNLGFDDIFELLFEISKKNSRALELIGCILFRMAYALDHNLDNQGNLRLNLPTKILKEIESKILDIKGIPIRAFIFILEAIALNEDVKYYTLGRNDEFKDGVGRRNNLLTYCHLIGVLLERTSFTKFVGSFARLPVGVSPLTQKTTFDVFPNLKPKEI
ncbi:MAG: hypothetical protein KAQ83_02915 [Nanoarchaeota archaeon]|nr:hypothetical protein [Nanoarchaeota archaeon]